MVEFDDDNKLDHSKNKRNAESLAIENIMRTEDGRSFIWGQLESCGTFESDFNKDPVQTGYNCGLRDAGLRLQRVVKEAAPDFYLKMMRENM